MFAAEGATDAFGVDAGAFEGADDGGGAHGAEAVVVAELGDRLATHDGRVVGVAFNDDEGVVVFGAVEEISELFQAAQGLIVEVGTASLEGEVLAHGDRAFGGGGQALDADADGARAEVADLAFHAVDVGAQALVFVTRFVALFGEREVLLGERGDLGGQALVVGAELFHLHLGLA